jgi:hypothetical protein
MTEPRVVPSMLRFVSLLPKVSRKSRHVLKTDHPLHAVEMLQYVDFGLDISSGSRKGKEVD